MNRPLSVFIDACVLMDFYGDREGADYAETILALSERGTIKLYTSSVIICTLAYLLEKYKTVPKNKIKLVIDDLCMLVNVLSVGKEHIASAIQLLGTDFEDNVEMVCAEENCDLIVTDNVKHFNRCNIPVKKPVSFLEENSNLFVENSEI